MARISCKKQRIRRKPPVRTFRMTISTFHYNKTSQQFYEIEMYFKVDRAASTKSAIRRIRSQLQSRGSRHFRRWLCKYQNLLVSKIYINFEHERRSSRQVEQSYVSVRRLIMQRVNRRWEAQELPSGKMLYAQRSRYVRKRESTAN